MTEVRWRLLYHPRVMEEDIPRLDGSTRQRIRRTIKKKLLTEPEQFAKPLGYNRFGLWSLRIGDWRVIFAMRETELWILRIGHRSDVYDLQTRQIPRS